MSPQYLGMLALTRTTAFDCASELLEHIKGVVPDRQMALCANWFEIALLLTQKVQIIS